MSLDVIRNASLRTGKKLRLRCECRSVEKPEEPTLGTTWSGPHPERHCEVTHVMVRVRFTSHNTQESAAPASVRSRRQRFTPGSG